MSIAPPAPSDNFLDFNNETTMQGRAESLFAQQAKVKDQVNEGGDAETEGFALPPDFDPRTDPLTTALWKYCRDGYAGSLAACQPDHDRWTAFQKLKDGVNPSDDPRDPLVAEYGVYFPIIARLISVWKANALNELLEDPATMDFFEAVARVEGIEMLGEKWTAILREKLRNMAPEDCQHGFFELVDRMIDDFCTFGNMFGVMSHDAVISKDGSIKSEGAVAEWLDPFNVTPWRTDVNNIAQTNVSIYSPISDYELDQQGYPEWAVKLVRSGETLVALPKRNPEGMTQYGEFTTDDQPLTWFDNQQYRRYIEFTRFPVFELMRQTALGMNVAKDDPVATAAQWIEKLGVIYGFDPMDLQSPALAEDGTPVRWWRMERIGPYLVMCEPYPLALPEGQGPIIHQTMIQRNGRLLGYGIYDRGQWDERFANFFRRADITLTTQEMHPPVWYDKTAIDPKWLQEHEGELDLEAYMKIPIVAGSGVLTRPIEAVTLGKNGIMLSKQGQASCDASLRELTGVYSALEGQDESGTATQSSNNLQQVRMEIMYYIRRAAFGCLRNMVRRVYSITRQVMQMLNMTQAVPVGNDEGIIQTLMVTPGEMVEERHVEIRIQTGNPLSTLQERLATLDRLTTKYIPMGVVPPLEAAKAEFKLAKVSGMQRLIPEMDPMQIQQQINFATGYGPGTLNVGPAGFSLLSAPIQQMLVGAPMPGSMPAQGGESPGSKPAKTPPSGQPSQTSAGAPSQGGTL